MWGQTHENTYNSMPNKTENPGIDMQSYNFLIRQFSRAYDMHLPHNPNPSHCVSYGCQSTFFAYKQYAKSKHKLMSEY